MGKSTPSTNFYFDHSQVRDSESKPGDFSISLKDVQKNKHFWVQFEPVTGQFVIGNRRFNSMEELIMFVSLSILFGHLKNI
jgi:hypothetical protein